MYTNAIKLASERLKVNSSDAMTLAHVAYYLSTTGQREQALQYMARATALAPNDMNVYYNSALMLSTLGERTDAVNSLKRAITLGYSMELASVDAGFEALKGMSEFEAVIAPQQ